MSTISITNHSGKPIYIYDWDMSLSPAATTNPIKGGDPLSSGGTVKLTMKEPAVRGDKPARRIYVAAERLTDTLQKPSGPVEPDGFTPWCNGATMFSFAEYNYEPDNNRYTFDISYLDDFSYPLTVKFTGSSGGGYVSGFEYGFTSLSKVISALGDQNDHPWSGLIWPTDDPKSPAYNDWPKGIYRVFGPNKLWTSDSCGMSTYAPDPCQNFVTSLPFGGTQLFGTNGSNFDVWKNSTSLPANTGYTKALHSAATPDSNGKYGFFAYCRDNDNGEFTFLPLDVECNIGIYGYDQ